MLICFLFLFIELVSAIEISPIRFLAINIESMCSYIHDYLWGIEVFNQNGSFRIRQKSDLIPVDYLILFGLIQHTEIGFFVLVQFKVLLHLFEGSQIFILRFGIVFIPAFGRMLLLHISFIRLIKLIRSCFTETCNTQQISPKRQATHRSPESYSHPLSILRIQTPFSKGRCGLCEAAFRAAPGRR